MISLYFLPACVQTEGSQPRAFSPHFRTVNPSSSWPLNARGVVCSFSSGLCTYVYCSVVRSSPALQQKHRPRPCYLDQASANPSSFAPPEAPRLRGPRPNTLYFRPLALGGGARVSTTFGFWDANWPSGLPRVTHSLTYPIQLTFSPRSSAVLRRPPGPFQLRSPQLRTHHSREHLRSALFRPKSGLPGARGDIVAENSPVYRSKIRIRGRQEGLVQTHKYQDPVSVVTQPRQSLREACIPALGPVGASLALVPHHYTGRALDEL
ncbi:hypothetical protein OF83DRAFT_735013 [Amylostereum chailletii]|nr:hypothetical protein OF83DRAFT_735013 [Amylostereum chailletii]